MLRDNTHSNREIKIVQLVLFFFGILTIAVGFFVIRPHLVQVAIFHSSPGKVLSAQGIALVNGFSTKLIYFGVLIILSSLIVGYVEVLQDLIVKKIESEHLIERTVSSLGSLLDLIYRIGTNEKFLWCLLLLIVTSFFSAMIFMSPWGGFHSSEGINFQPPKNLAIHGIYATLTTRGFDEYTHRISAGPGILLLHALVFKIFGINVYYSRVLFAIFNIATLIIFYHVARDLYGKKVALIALWFVVFSPGMFLRAIGGASGDAYVPALCYFLIGTLFWFKSIDTKKNMYLIISGLFWGLSFQTQWLFLFAIFAAILTCIILSISKKGLGSKYYLIPSSMVLLVTIAWFIFRIINVGLRLEFWHLVAFWGEHGPRAFGGSTEEGVVTSILAIARPIASLSQIDIWGNFQLFLIIPAILYAIILIGKSKWTDYKSLFFISFILVWFAWWLLFNYDLAALHLNTVTLVSQLFIAKVLYDIWEFSSSYKGSFLNLTTNKETQKATMVYLLRVAIICIVLGRIVIPLIERPLTTYNYYLTLTKPYKEMMTYLRNNTEKNAVFSGWDWSMPWYVDLDDTGDHINKDRATYPPEQRESVPEYFIVSPEWPLVKATEEWPSVSTESRSEMKQNGIRKRFLEQNCTLVKIFGGDKHKWLLYKVNNDNLAQLLKK